MIAFYYPEKTTIEMGPTAVVSGTHLLEHVPVQNPSAADPVWRPVEKYLACEAGAVVLCDFRLVHKVRSGVWPQLPTAQTRSPCGRSLGSVRLRALIHAFARPFTLRIPPLPHTYPIHAETPSHPRTHTPFTLRLPPPHPPTHTFGWHSSQGCGNRSQRPRWMFKYNFFRTTVGALPSWKHEETAWRLPPHPTLPQLSPVCLDIWRAFMLGNAAESDGAGDGAGGRAGVGAGVGGGGKQVGTDCHSAPLSLLLPPPTTPTSLDEPTEQPESDSIRWTAGAAPPPPDVTAALQELIRIESEQAVQARAGALAAAAGHTRGVTTGCAAELIGRLASTLLPDDEGEGGLAPKPKRGRPASRVPPPAVACGLDHGLPTDTTARCVAVAIGVIAELAPSAAADAFGRLLLAPSATAHHAAMGIAHAAVRLQRRAQASEQGAPGEIRSPDEIGEVADAFVRPSVLMLTSALGRQALTSAVDQEVPQHGANGHPPLACALVSALGMALSCVQTSQAYAQRRIHLYDASVAAIHTALISGSVVSSDAVLAIGRIGSAAAATATALASHQPTAAGYRCVVHEAARVLRTAESQRAARLQVVYRLDFWAAELAQTFLQRWAVPPPQVEEDDDDEKEEDEEEAAADAGGRKGVRATLGKMVVVVNKAQGAQLAISSTEEGSDKGVEGAQRVARGLATLHVVDSPAAATCTSSASTKFDLQPTRDGDDSHFLVHAASGKPLHLDGLGDKLASTRYGNVRDDYSKFLLEAVPGDPSGAVYLINKQTRMPLHANGLGDMLISTRFGNQRDTFAQWTVHLI